MGLFDRLKKETSPSASAVIYAPASGEVVEMKNIADPVFSEGVLGFCCGIEPTDSDGRIFAPCGGVVTQLSETMHAIGLETEDGVEILIHVGVDTVDMQGEGFAASCAQGNTVTKGQLLLTADIGKIREAGYCATVITVVTNSDSCKEVKLKALGNIEAGGALIEVIK